MKKNDVLRLGNQMVFPLYLCSKEMIRRYSVYLNEIDLTYTQYIVMCFFWERKTSNVKELGKIMLLDSSTLTPLLKKLQEKGYIDINKSNDDERNIIISLTNSGIELKDDAIEVPKAIAETINISDKEAIQLYSTLYKILDN